MFVIRPIRVFEFDILYEFASLARGMTSLIKDEKVLQKLLDDSVRSFQTNVREPENEYYLFVLEDFSTGRNGGVSAVRSVSAHERPLYFYTVENQVLYPKIVKDGPSELCSLFLHAEFRKGGLGRLLSMSRFHFIAAFPERFKKTLFAEMRGYIADDKHSPFWDSLGFKSAPIPYEHAEFLMALNDPSITTFFSETPISFSSLTKEAIDAIGKTHPNTVPALKMLEGEGFLWTNDIDIVDGGPKISCEIENVWTIQASELLILASPIVEEIGKEIWLVSNNRLDFRAVMSQLEKSVEGIHITQEAMNALNIKIGEQVRVSRLHHDKL